MKKLTLMIVVVMATLVFLGSNSRTAQAEEISCTGTLGNITVDNILVPQNATCTLNRTIVQGSIVVSNGAVLRTNRASVVGNIQAEGATLVRVVMGTVGGSIQIVQGAGALIDRVHVNGDILLDSNNRALSVKSNVVGGNVQVFQNLGGVNISLNMIDGNLQCLSNTPAPIGGGNIVQGNKENQCAGL